MPSPTTNINITTNVPGTYNYTLSPSGGGTAITGSNTAAINSAISSFSVTAPLDDYDLSITNPTSGAVLNSSHIPANLTSNVYAQSVLSSDTGNVGISQTPITSGAFQSNSTASPNIMIPPVTAEVFTAANGPYGRYFTSQDARLYIGDLFIDENIFVQFTAQDNKIPIYGYRSRFYDATAQGKSIVQGQLGLNFVSEGYLYTVLQEYQRVYKPNQNSVQTTLNNLVYTKTQIQNRIAQNAQTGQSDPTDANQLTLVNQKIAQSKGDFTIAQKYATTSIPLFPEITDEYSNALYPAVAFDLVIQLEGAQRTVTRKIEGCQLIANDQVIDTSGNALSDGYSFIARRIR